MTYTELDRDAVDRALPNDAPLPVDPSPSDDLGHRDSRHASVGGGTLLDRGHRWDGSRFTSAPVDPSLPADRGRNDASTVSVGGETPLDRGPRRLDTHTPVAPVDPPLPDPAGVRPTPQTVASDPGAFDELRILAESFEDAQKARIAIENRLRGAVVSDASLDALDALRLAEKRLGLAMRRSFRKAAPELAAWQKETVGVGEHLLARLLGTIGDPYIARPHHWEGEGSARVLVADEPFARNVAKLWAYTGHGDPGRRRRKGMSADEAFALGNPRAKMIVHLLAEGAMKCVGSPAVDSTPPGAESPATDAPLLDDGAAEDEAPPRPDTPRRRRSPYRDVYDDARGAVLEREDWTDAHKHAHALRLVGKEILRDLWTVRRDALLAEEVSP